MSDQSAPEKMAPRPTPTKNNFRPAVFSFVSGGLVVTMGDINKHQDDIQVAFTSKHTGTDAPFLGIRIRF